MRYGVSIPAPVGCQAAHPEVCASRLALADWWHAAGLIYVGGRLYHRSWNNPHGLLHYNPCRTAGRTGPTRLHDTKIFLSRGVGVSHWGNVPELVRFVPAL